MKRNYPGKKATFGWVCLAAYVLAYDLWAIKGDHETLSGAFWRGLERPGYRWVVVLSWAVVTKHLVLPEVLARFDPLSILAGHTGRKNGE